MSFFFRKRLGLGPLNLNLTKSGIGFSLGVRGFRAGVSSSGRRYISTGFPGTGIYYRQFARKQRQTPRETAPSPAAEPSAYPIAHPHTIGYGLGYLVGWLLILSPVALLLWLVAHLMR